MKEDEEIISNIAKEFAKKINNVKETFILEELKPYYTYNSNGGIEWSQKVLLRLAEYKDFKNRFNQEKKIIGQKLIDELCYELKNNYKDNITEIDRIPQLTIYLAIKKYLLDD